MKSVRVGLAAVFFFVSAAPAACPWAELSPGAPLHANQIHYQLVGAGPGKETIVFVHGLGGDLRTWQGLASELTDRYQVLMYDQRGHGQTSGEGDDYSSRTMAGDLLALLDALKIGKAHLVGHSMGARCVIRFAAEHPERVSSVTLEDMHLMGRHTRLPDRELPDILARLPKNFGSRSEAREAVEEFYPRSGQELLEAFLHKNADGTFSFEYKEDPELFYHNQGLQEDLTDALKATKAPILFIQADPGTGDAVLWGKGVDHIRSNRPDAAIVTVPETKHGVHYDNPRAYYTLLTRFLQGKPVGNLALPDLDSPLMPHEIHMQVLRARVLGEGQGQTLVLIHDGDQDARELEDAAKALSEKYNVVLYDQRGFGYTHFRGHELSSTVLASDLHSLLDRLGLKQVSLLGHGRGAKTALRFAKDNSERTRALVLEDPEIGSIQAPPADMDLPTLFAGPLHHHYENRDQAVAALQRYFPKAVAEGIASECYFDKRLEYSDSAGQRYLQQAGGEDLSRTLQETKTPTLLLAADPKHGAHLTEEEMARLKEGGSQGGSPVRMQTVAGADHWIHLSRPQEFLAAVRAFLDNPR